MEWWKIVLLVTAIVVLFIWYVNHANNYARDMIKVGLAAAQSYVMTGQEDALIASLTVIAGMSKQHRSQYLLFVSNIPTNEMDEGEEKKSKQRHQNLMQKLVETKTSIVDATKYRKQLDDMNSMWLDAILKRSVPLADKASIDAMAKGLGSG